jgi:serine/threonine-protein kinase ULK/ATG1
MNRRWHKFLINDYRLSETPPPPNTWQVSPVARHSHTPSGTSPLRRSTGNNSASSPLLTGPLAVLGSPTSRALQDNNNTLRHSPVIPFGTRAVTLPEISGNILFRLSEYYIEIIYIR